MIKENVLKGIEEEKTFETELRRDYPLVYPCKVSCGVYCPKGWRDAVRDLSILLQNYLEQDAQLTNRGFSCAQIKEKFGGLRWYYDGDTDDTINSLIAKTEEVCWKICQHCGKPGKTGNIGYWLMTLCEECREEQLKEREERMQRLSSG